MIKTLPVIYLARDGETAWTITGQPLAAPIYRLPNAGNSMRAD